jgi:hypothetical protein
MKRNAYKLFLVTRFRGPHSGGPLPTTTAPSYASYAASAERALGDDLDALDLGEKGLVTVLSRLRRAGAEGLLSAKMVNNCGSAVRAYAQFMAEGSGGDETDEEITATALRPRATAPRPPRGVVVERPTDPLIKHMSVKGLLAMHGAIMDELQDREIVRTANAPGGDYAEKLFARAFGWTLATSSSLGFDAIDSDGVRYQVKSRRLGRNGGTRQLGAIRRLPEKAFDHLAAVLFDPAYGVARAIILPHDQVEPLARYQAHTNSWTFMLDDRMWNLPGARDVTAELSAAAAAF